MLLKALEITSMSNQGQGVGRDDSGKTLFVDGALVGDVVDAVIIEDKKRFAFAKLANLVTHSPSRIPSPCKFSSLCGGCPWIDLAADAQHHWKEHFVRDTLTRMGKITIDVPVEFQASPTSIHTRNRIQLRGTLDGKGLHLGFLKSKSWDQVHIDTCVMADAEITGFLLNLAPFTMSSRDHGSFSAKLRMTIQHLPARKEAGLSHLLLTIHPVNTNASWLPKLLEHLRQAPDVCWAGSEAEAKEAGPIFSFEHHLGLEFFTSPALFQQVHVGLNRRLREIVQQHVEASNVRSVLDLYCGSGNLSLALASPQRQVTGIETNVQAIAVAQHNVIHNSIPNCTYQADHLSMRQAESSSKKRGRNTRLTQHYDLVIADPPRAGMKDVIPDILRMAPQEMIYVSCDLATLARDLAALKEQYRMTRLLAFDFFPNTFHVETVAFLTRAL